MLELCISYLAMTKESSHSEAAKRVRRVEADARSVVKCISEPEG